MNYKEIIGAIGVNPYYQDEWVTIYHRDCRDILPLIPDKSIDLVLTDPPYGIGEASGKNKSRGKWANATDYGCDNWDDKPVEQGLIDYIVGRASHSIIFGGNYYRMPPSPCWIIWDKENGGSDFADCELAWTNFHTAVRRFRFRWQGMLQGDMKNKDYRYHPTQKPTALFNWILGKYSQNSELILGPFLGSGTTAYCAKKLNRKCIGIEIEEKYCEIAAKRCSQQVFNFTGDIK